MNNRAKMESMLVDRARNLALDIEQFFIAERGYFHSIGIDSFEVYTECYNALINFIVSKEEFIDSLYATHDDQD